MFFRLYAPYDENTEDSKEKAWHSLVNVIILLFVVVVMTFALVLLYKYECYKVQFIFNCCSLIHLQCSRMNDFLCL